MISNSMSKHKTMVMGANDRNQESISFSMSEPSLREQAPASLRRAGPLREKFIAANDREVKPPVNTWNDGRQYSDEERHGSEMVKRQRPYPELKPSFADYSKRTSFNQEWMREQRAAQIHQFESQRQIAPQQDRLSEPSFER